MSGEIKNGLGSFYRGDGFQNRNPAWVPEVFIAPYGYVLPWAELIFGALLLVGLFSRISAGAVALMLLTIGIALMGAGELFPRHHVMVFFSLSSILWVWGGAAVTALMSGWPAVAVPVDSLSSSLAL